MADKYFAHNTEWHVAICKECQCVVWADHVTSHLTGKHHKLRRRTAESITDSLRLWPGIIEESSAFVSPLYLSQPILDLPIFTNGLQCQLSPRTCRYICRDEKTIRNHWRLVHEWSPIHQRGAVASIQKKSAQENILAARRVVRCQRFCKQGQHSHYIAIEGRYSIAAPQQPDLSAWNQAWSKATEYYDEVQKKASETITEGEADEVNPWLRRTGWVQYLDGYHHEQILRLVQQPASYDKDDVQAAESNELESLESTIWQAMADVAQISQSSVKASGIMLRMHAVRTEKDQVCYQPLQPYWDEDSIRKHCHPWQQMLMFFVRTQRSDEQNPKYKFSRRQFTAFEQLLKEAERVVQGEEREVEDQQTPDQLPSSTSNKAPASLDSLQLACLNFCIELLNQKVNDNEYDCALVCAAALLGVSPSESGWRDATTYPQILSSIIKIAHFLIVQKAVELSRVEEEESSFSLGQSLEDFDDSGYQSHSSPVSKSVRRSRLDWVVQMMDRFMVRRTNSPMDWFLDLRTYGMKIQFNTTAEGHVMWKDRHILQYKTLSFSMASFRAMVYDLQQSTRKALFENLLFAPQAGDVPSIPWHALYDDPSNSSVGWNFLDDPRNQLPVDGRSWLPNRIEKIDEIRDRFLRNGSISGFSREYITDFLRQVYYFRGLLLVLIHLTGGQPARGTEILSVRHRNTAQGSHRNLFIEDGLVVFVTRYSKGYQLRGDVKIIHRYLPREVGELVVWYLWLVLPFVQQIEALLWKQDQISSHLWPADVDGKRWTTDRMTKVLKQTSLTSLQQPLTVQSYRQIAIAISREWLQGETPFPLDNESDGDNEGSSPDHAADLQATHSSHIAGMVYARESTERSGVNAGLRQRFRKVSLDWHCFLRFPSTSKRAPDAPKYPFEEEELTAEHARRRRLQRVDVQKEVCQMLGRSTILRDGQAAGLASVLQGTSPIVAVMPTGSGKSLLFMLPAWLEPRGVSIVVVPLLALREDLIFRCQQVGIQCAIWDGRQQPDGATLVFVTPEKAVDEAFSSYLSRLKQARQLDRIVIDECHVVLNDQLHFRPHLQRLGQLAQGETQMLLLTATLPPCQQNDLFVRILDVGRDQM
jgi:hypothetical protein